MTLSKDFIAGLKMGNKPMMAAGVLEMLGASAEDIADAKNTQRFTSAAIDRVFKPYMGEDIPEATQEEEKQPTLPLDTKDEPKYPDVEKAIAKGKKKKALKLIKKLEKENPGSMLLAAHKKEAEGL
jgi:hypothetical protein